MNEPKFVEGTLAWCNKIRAMKGLPKLTKLPKGRKHDPQSCPCGQATGLFVGPFEYRNIRTVEDPHIRWSRVPTSVRRFIYAFDSGMLPQYETKESYE